MLFFSLKVGYKKSTLNLKKNVFFKWLQFSSFNDDTINLNYFNLIKGFYYGKKNNSHIGLNLVVKYFLYVTTKYIDFYSNLSVVNHIYYPYRAINYLHNLLKYNYGLILSHNYITIITKNEFNFNLINLLKNSQLYSINSLLDICVTDYPQRKNRFELLYCLLSVINNTRLFTKFFISELNNVNSLCSIFSSANWLEREAWDLYGVFFSNHPDLRRILTDYGFKGFPFRKDFPLTGYVEVRFDDEQYAIVYEPLEVSQEFRSFNFRSPWEEFVV